MRLVWTTFLALCFLALGQGLAQEDEKKLPPRKPGHVLVQFLTVPSHARATVYHGRKKLGETPLYIQFPKNSGPRDVVLKRGGYLWVNTRANTFKDDKIIVKMTKNEEASTLFGYRQAINPDGGVDAGSDGGVESDAGVSVPATAEPSSPPTTP